MYLRVMLTLLVIVEAAAAAILWRAAEPPAGAVLYTAEEQAAGLHARVGGLKLPIASSMEATQALSHSTRVTFDVNWSALKPDGAAYPDDTVGVYVYETTLGDVLAAAFGDKVSVGFVGRRAIVTSADAAYASDESRTVVRAYDVGDLMAALTVNGGNALTPAEVNEAIADYCAQRIWDERFSCGTSVLVVGTPEEQRRAASLMQAMRDALNSRSGERQF